MKIQHKFNLSLILGILVIVEFIGLCYVYKNNIDEPIETIDTKNEISKIDSIIVKRDTLIININKSASNIQIAKEQYHKDSIVISNQSIYEDVEFFSNYISSYNE